MYVYTHICIHMNMYIIYIYVCVYTHVYVYNIYSLLFYFQFLQFYFDFRASGNLTWTLLVLQSASMLSKFLQIKIPFKRIGTD